MPTADELLSAETVRGLARCLNRIGIPAASVAEAADSLAGATFSERVRQVRDAVLTDTPDDFASFRTVIEKALRDAEFDGWMVVPVTEAVAVRGLNAFESALDLLAALTPRLSSESAVRQFLNADLHRALAVIERWTDHPDEHVRRLASEGTRPRLPWTVQIPALIKDPAPALPILDSLYRDDSEYVRRSVANHLNDISKDHPSTAVEVAERWLGDPGGNTERVVKHALRTLIKKGDAKALELLGYSPNAQVAVTEFVVDSPTVPLGSSLDFHFSVTNVGPADTALAVDYVIHHVKSNGTRTPKVFKLATRTLAPADTWNVKRRHAIRPITTRRYYPGVHMVELQVNGVSRGTCEFTLEM